MKFNCKLLTASQKKKFKEKKKSTPHKMNQKQKLNHKLHWNIFFIKFVYTTLSYALLLINLCIHV